VAISPRPAVSPSCKCHETPRSHSQDRAEWLGLIRHGRRHDWYQNPRTGVSQPIPRHREIKEPLAKHILKELQD